jgi:Fe2+ transport system protein FeoA
MGIETLSQQRPAPALDPSTLELRPPAPSSTSAPRLVLTAALAGRSYEVAAVLGDDALARRLSTAGVWPGARLELIAKAPFGDPMLFRVHGYRLALRRSEAERVEVCAVEAGGPEART